MWKIVDIFDFSYHFVKTNDRTIEFIQSRFKA